ncbi:ATP-binding cassette domain-containing protein [Actinacidiphila glaucinigra]|uniref:ATP-binding cassette domain-containing protein n=1 Tax=Actinacidiphila glaucinigra TaxID=235986 RepID=UPI0036E1BB98
MARPGLGRAASAETGGRGGHGTTLVAQGDSAGKSTTIRLLLGLARPTAGRASIFGTDVGDGAETHRHLAYVPADVALWPQLTGAEMLELPARTGPGTDRSYRDELTDRFDPNTPAACMAIAPACGRPERLAVPGPACPRAGRGSAPWPGGGRGRA